MKDEWDLQNQGKHPKHLTGVEMTLRMSDPERFDSSRKCYVTERFGAKQYFRVYSSPPVVYNVVGNEDGERQGARQASHTSEDDLGR